MKDCGDDASLAVALDGTAVVEWEEDNGHYRNRFASIRERNGEFGPPVKLGGDALDCGGVAAARGGAVAVGCDYHDSDGERKGVAVFVRKDRGRPLRRMKFSTYEHSNDVVSDAAVTRQGRVDLTLYDNPEYASQVVAARVRAGRTDSGEFERISSAAGSGHQIEVDANGNLLAAWGAWDNPGIRTSQRPGRQRLVGVDDVWLVQRVSLRTWTSPPQAKQSPVWARAIRLTRFGSDWARLMV